MNEPSFWQKLRHLVGRPPQPSPTPVPPLNSPSPPSWQTAEASKHLATAQNYLFNIGDDISKYAENARDQFLRTVQVATQYIQKAQELDPNATSDFTDPKSKQVVPRTADQLARIALFYEGQATVDWSRYRDEVERGIKALLQARAFDPHRSEVCAALGRGYLRLGKKADAHKYLKEALILDPSDFRSQKLLDGIEPVRILEQRPSVFENAIGHFVDHPVLSLFLLSALCFAASCVFNLVDAGLPIIIISFVGCLAFAFGAVALWWSML